MTQILQSVHEEGLRIVDAARARDVPLRVLGGVAIRMHAPGGLPPALARTYQDIDLMTVRGAGGRAQELLVTLGYDANERFNALNGAERMVFYDRAHERQLDVFVGAFRMCHAIPLTSERIAADPLTLPLAELLLTKLQIVSVNEKDLRDVFGLLLEHDVSDHDDDAIDATVVARLLARDWGLWRTSRTTLERARAHLDEVPLDPAQRALVRERIERLWERVEAEPKPMRWRSRNRIGDRVRWYEQPDEIGHAR